MSKDKNIDKPKDLFYFLYMSLTLEQFLLLVITLALVAFIAYLIPVFRQFKETVKKADELLTETKELITHFQETEKLIKTQIDGVSEFIQSSKEALSNIGDIAWFISKKLLRPSARYLSALLPLINAGWKLYKKRKKGGKNEQ